MIRPTPVLLFLLSVIINVDMTMAFAPSTPSNTHQRPTSLQATKNDSNIGKAMTASLVAASVFFLAAPDALALPPEQQPPSFDSSSQVLAARSGGRMGGRSYSGSRAAPSRSPSRTSTTTYSRTTVVRPAAPAVIVAPSPFGFNPFFPSPFGYGFGGGIGDTLRDYRQDDEIARDRRELEQQRMKNMELEQRLAQLERSQQQSAPAVALPPQVVQQATATADPELEAQQLKNAELEQKIAQLEGRPVAK